MADIDFIKKLKRLMPKSIKFSMIEKQRKRVLRTKFENSDRPLSINFRIF